MPANPTATLLLTLACALPAGAQQPEDRAGPDALAAEIAGLRADDVVWRGIAWQSCLLDGLRIAREQDKPALLWVFIDRPVDDARC